MKHYLTKEKYESLQKELKALQSTGRREIAERLRYAKSLGDLSENADYQEAREQQSILERRIQEVEEILRRAVIIEKQTSAGAIAVGSRVELRRDKTLLRYTIVGSQEAKPSEGLVSNRSPMGVALLGKSAGDVVKIKTPKGEVEYEVVSIQ